MDMTKILPVLRVRVGLPEDDTSKDTEITAAWETAVDLAEQYCDRRFDFKADAQEEFVYEADRTISLERYPLKSITQVTADDGTSMPAPIRFDKKTGILYAEGFANDAHLLVTYAGGYETLPPSLFQALLYAFDGAWSNLTSTTGSGGMVPSGDIKAISAPDVGRVEFETSSTSTSTSVAWGLLPANATAILDRGYRREFA